MLEYAFFLDELQFLFLLSMLDSRPVVGIPMPDAAQIPPETWNQVVLSLVQENRLQYVEHGGLSIHPQLSRLLCCMKDAGTTAVFYVQDVPQAHLLYFGHEGVVNVRPHGQTEYRLCQIDAAAWLEEVLPRRVPTAEEFPVEGDAMLAEVFAEKVQQALPLEAPPSAWGKTAAAVADIYHQTEGAVCRWIWPDNPMCTIALKQDAAHCEAAADTQQLRAAFLRECQNGEEK